MMRRLLLRIAATKVAALPAVACLCAAAMLDAKYKVNPEWNVPATPHRVIGNIYYVGTTELTSFAMRTPKGLILLETGMEETVPVIKAGLQKLGLNYSDIKILLTSQAHYDHAAGLALVKRETGAQVAAMGPDAALLEAGGHGDFRFGDELTFPAVKVDRVLKDGDTLELGGFRLTALHTPGHTKGATTFTTRVEENGRSYDVVFATSISVNPGTALVNNRKYPNIVSDWEKTYRVLKSLTPDVWFSSHAGFFDLKGKSARLGANPNPYIDPAGYRQFVENGERQFRALLAKEGSQR
jgi:metallo-beta-lactamase class B